MDSKNREKKYHMGEILGEGGAGTVYLGQSKAFGGDKSKNRFVNA